MFRFRLSTLFVVTTLVAVLTFAWMRFVVPNVTSVRIANGQVVLSLTDELGRKMLSTGPVGASLSTSTDSDLLIHDSTISFSLFYVVLAILFVLLPGYGIIIVARKLRHRP